MKEAKENAQRPPCQPKIHKNTTYYMPKSTETATHAYVKKAKPLPLGPKWDGPYEIVKRPHDAKLHDALTRDASECG